MSRTWEQENNTILYNSFLQYLDQICSPDVEKGLELYITSSCNQSCEYCYLYKYEDQLYPPELRNHDLILQNLDLLIDYFIEHKKFPHSIDFFSGEIWNQDFGYQVLTKVLRLLKAADENHTPVAAIMIPSNCSFIFEDKWRKAFDECIRAYAYYNCTLTISCSYDGPLIESTNRPFKGKKDSAIKDSEEYAKTILDWGKEHNFGYHPMVNAHAIEKWPEQFKWWIDELRKRDMLFWNSIMFLEVRNNEWTEDKIISYLKYLNSSMDYLLETYYKDRFKSFFSYSGGVIPPDEKDSFINYNCFSYCPGDSVKGCSVDRMMCIRLGDLAWCPCHRTSYDKLLYGKLVVEDNKIVGIQALNIPLFVHINSASRKGWIKCDTCAIANHCMSGCYGAQFETSKEIFYPCETVCNLFFAKDIFLYHKYNKLLQETGIEDTLDPALRNSYNSFKNSIHGIPKEVFDKWTKISQSII